MYTLPAANQSNWTPGDAAGVGVAGGIDRFLAGSGHADERPGLAGTVIDVTASPYNADNTGIVDASSAIRAAIVAASPGDVVYCPAGTYLLSVEVAFYYDDGGITVRGDGPGVTIFKASSGKGFNSYNGGTFGANPAIVSGTKTKGNSVLTVDTVTGYDVGQAVRLVYENMEDDALIEAGEVPTWTQKGFPHAQFYNTVVTAVQTSPNRITVKHPLPMDATNRGLKVTNRDVLNPFFAENVGFEDFSIEPIDASFGWGIILFRMRNSWVLNVETSGSENRGILLDEAINCEIRRCKLGGTVGYSSDGLIGITAGTHNLIWDNIFTDGNYAVYDDGNSVGNAYLFNFGWNLGHGYLGHGAHPCLNLFEGNVYSGMLQDGYHGGSSHQTYFKNWLHGRYQDDAPTAETIPMTLNRMVRYTAVVGNVLGRDGANDFHFSYGNPNMGNGNATGFAGPTGLSDQVGEADYLQPGYGVFEYIIQPGDVSEGDFWADWKLTGTVTARTDTTATITMDGSVGQLRAGQGYFNNGPAVWWDNYASGRTNLDIDHIDGLDVYFINPPDTAWLTGMGPYGAPNVFPIVGTVVKIGAGTHGFQERDLDVKVSTTDVHNYRSTMSTGAVFNPTVETLPDSLACPTQPDWWDVDGYGCPYPPVDPNAPNFSYAIIPAGARFLDESPPDPPDPPAAPVTMLPIDSKRRGLLCRA